jgi:hypothetical protein
MKTLSNAFPANVAEAIPPVVAEATIYVVVTVQRTVANSLTN